MLNSIKRYTFLIVCCCVNLCLASPQQYHYVKGGHELDNAGVPVKSYGGVGGFAGTQAEQPSYHQQIQQPILPFPFYGFNFVQPQQQQQQFPVRTYGGIVNNQQSNFQPGFGFFGAGVPQDQGQVNANVFPPLPNYTPFIFPQFTPQFYNPPQFPFPNFNLFPFGIPNNNNPVGFHPQPPPPAPEPPIESSTEAPEATESTFIIQVTPTPTTESPDEFASNSLFGEGSSADRREWTVEDEKAWQATTRAPYFENKVPGMDCSLPAAAVLGATSALKVSSLLPLEIPVGRPILSCNATNLAQAIISLDGTLYDCHRASITLSCPRASTQFSVVDRCLGRSLKCDEQRRTTSRKVSCTNGTLISDHSITCKSAHLTQTKNILNCVFTYGSGENEISGVDHVSTTLPDGEHNDIHVVPLSTTTEKVQKTTTAETFNEDNYDDVDLFDVRVGEDSALPKDLQRSLRKVFPSGLLALSSQRLSLPPANSLRVQSENHKIPGSLKTGLDGVFPHKLFAISQLSEPADVEQRLSAPKGQQRTTKKIPAFYVRVEDDENDRHIFSP